MTEYQCNKYKIYKRGYEKKNRERMHDIKERDNMINIAMRLLFEYQDYSAAMRYVKWKIRQIHNKKGCLCEQASS